MKINFTKIDPTDHRKRRRGGGAGLVGYFELSLSGELFRDGNKLMPCERGW